MDKTEILLSSIKVGTHTSANRFFVQAMECTDTDTKGNPSDLTYQRYENLFKGEAGIVSLEAITITDKNRSRLNQLFIMPKNQPALSKFVVHLKKINSKTIFIFQLTHSGELNNPEFSKASFSETPTGIRCGYIH
jgi:2,4-dienoyl-CoA reductase-like NADH-dependent reductase (Old Yellow Enzyme family)